MTPFIAAILFIFLLVTAIALVFFLVYHLIKWNQESRRKTKQKWANLAQNLGLTTKQGKQFPGIIEGGYKGFWVRIDTYVVSSNNSSQTYTRLRTYHHPPLGLGFKIEREGLFTGISKVLGSQDIETGDTNFDNNFLIKGHNVTGVLAMLNLEVRQAMLRYDQRPGHLKMDDNCITTTLTGLIIDQTKIEPILLEQVRLLSAVRQAMVAADPAFAQEKEYVTSRRS